MFDGETTIENASVYRSLMQSKQNEAAMDFWSTLSPLNFLFH